MSLCTEVGRWIDENIEQPVEQFFENARQECTDARRWVEREIRRPIETWRQQQEQQCREQECNWWCLCCNKWFCTIITILVRIVEWIIEFVGEWLVETICHLIIEIVRVIVMVLIKVTRWVVEAIVCIIEKACAYLYFLAGVTLTAVLVGGILGAGAVMLPGGLAVLAATVVGTIGAIALALLLCEPSVCRLLGLLLWSLKWAIVIGIVSAIVMLSVASAFVVVVYGGASAAVLWTLQRRGCPIPRMLGWP